MEINGEKKDIRLISWLLQGDVSIQYQVHRDLLGETKTDLQKRIENEGWGKAFLLQRQADLHWGGGFYHYKWISTHYTLLDLRNLCINPGNSTIQESIHNVLKNSKARDGGIMLGESTKTFSDVCVNGMFLNYASYFRSQEKDLESVVDCILNEIMPDGGFNCRTTRSGARHSSLHTTLSVLEGLFEFLYNGNGYRRTEIQKAIKSAEEFILIHRLYLSDKTGDIIRKDFLRLPYPSRWKYDILRALDYFRYSQKAIDERMEPALNILQKRRLKDGSWKVNAPYKGKVHLKMEQAGKPSRWNTLRALRVFSHFGLK